MLKNRIIVLLVVIIFALPSFAVNDINALELEEINPEVETIVPKVDISDDGISEAAAKNDSEHTDSVSNSKVDTETALSQMQKNALPYKQPVSKKKLIKKFLLAMLGVAGSSILLYAVFSIYNRIRYGSSGGRNEYYGEDAPLVTPNNIHDAVRSFVDKTKWDN